LRCFCINFLHFLRVSVFLYLKTPWRHISLFFPPRYKNLILAFNWRVRRADCVLKITVLSERRTKASSANWLTIPVGYQSPWDGDCHSTVQGIPGSFGTRNLIVLFITAYYRILSWNELISSCPCTLLL
jgi:hypothetical protein